MPIYTEEQKRRLLQAKGLSPDEYEFDEATLTAVPRLIPLAQPSVTEPSITELSTKNVAPSGLETMGRAALQSVVPTAAGVGTMALGAAAFPPTSLLGIGGLALAGLGAGYGASRAQEALVPEEIQQRFFLRPEDIEANKYWAAAGGFIPSLLTGRPSLKDLGTLATLPKALLTRAPEVGLKGLTGAQQNVLMNVLLNTVPQAGMEAAEVIGGEKPLDIPGALANILPGALLTRTTPLSRLLGFRDAPESYLPATIRKPTAKPPALSKEAPPIDIGRAGGLVESQELFEREITPLMPGEEKPRVIKLTPKGLEAREKAQYAMEGLGPERRKQLEQRTQEAELARLEAEGAPPLRRGAQTEGEYFTLAEQQKRAQQEQERATQVEQATRQLEQQQAEIERLSRTISRIEGEKRRPTTGPEPISENILRITKPAIERQEARLAGPEQRPVVGAEEPGVLPPVEEPPLTEAERIQEEYDLGKRQSNEALVKDTQTEINKLTQEQRDVLQRRLTQQARLRGFKVQEVPEIKSGDKSIAGDIDLANRVIRISTSMRGAETRPHEGQHGFINDLLNSSDAKDVQLALKGLEFAGGQRFKSAEEWFKFLADEPARAKAIEEQWVKQGLDLETLNQTRKELYGARRERFLQWAKNVKSHIKTKFGMATPEDINRYVGVRYRKEAPYGTRGEYFGGAKPGAGVRESDEGLIPEEELPKAIANVKKFGMEEAEKGRRFIGEQGKRFEDLGREGIEEAAVRGTEMEEQLQESAFQAAKDVIEPLDKVTKDRQQATIYANRVLRDIISTEAQKRKLSIDVENSEFLAKEFMKDNPNIERNIKKIFGDEFYSELEQERFSLQNQLEQFKTEEKRTIDEVQKEKIPRRDFKTEELEAFSRPDLERQSVESLIKEDFAKELPHSYGHWISPEGEMYRVPNFKHSQAADYLVQQMIEKGEIDSNELKKMGVNAMKILYRKGWLRGVHEFGSYSIETEFGRTDLPLTNLQKRVLKNYAIEKNTDINAFEGKKLIAKKPSIEGREQEEASIKEEPNTTPSVIDRFFASATQKVRNIGGDTAEHIATLGEKHAATRSVNLGRYRNTIQAEITSYPREVRNRVDQYGRDMMEYGESDIVLSPYEESLYDSVRDYLKVIADENVALREISKDPNYWPQILDSRVAHMWSKAPNSPEAKRFKREWMEHAQEQVAKGKAQYTQTELEDILDQYINAIGGEEPSLTFGALRKAAGLGLPVSMQDNNLLSRFSRYGRRVANDKAFQILENDPIARYVLRIPDKEGNVQTEVPKLPSGELIDKDLRGSEPIQEMKRFIYQEFPDQKFPRMQAASRMVSSALLGTATGVRNLVQAPNNLLAVVGTRNAGSLLTSLKDWNSSMRDSFAYNARQIRMNELEFGSAASPDNWVKTFNEVADFLRKYSGRELAEQWERAYSFGVGKAAALAEFGRAQKGNTQAIDWLKKHGNTVDNLEELLTANAVDIPDDALNRIAKSVVDSAAGSYDERGLPIQAFEGPLSPFLSLSRWSIEKGNRIYSDIIKPAKSGDIGPLLGYTLGSLLTGAAIRELNEIISGGKKPLEPTVKEAVEAKNIPQTIRSVVGLAQLGSFAGIVSDIMKGSADVLAAGKMPRGLSYPLVDFVSETMTQNVTDYFAAVNGGEDPFEAGKALAETIMRDSVQSMRLLSYLTWNKDEVERKNAYRDVRLWQEMMHKATPTSRVERPNEFVDIPAKKFKRAKTLEEAAEALPGALEGAARKSEDVLELKKKFEGLRRNTYQTVPKEPAEMMQYLQYLAATQGEDEAVRRFTDYLQQTTLNRLKKGMVPKF